MNKLDEALRSMIQKQDEYIAQLEMHCQKLRTQCDQQQQLITQFKLALDESICLLEQEWLKDKQKPE